MAEFVYVIGNYDEDGLENVAATTDRSAIAELLERYCDLLSGPHREQDRDEVFAIASEVLAIDDVELATRDSGTNLTRGWGGVKLYVIRLHKPEEN